MNLYDYAEWGKKGGKGWNNGYMGSYYRHGSVTLSDARAPKAKTKAKSVVHKVKAKAKAHKAKDKVINRDQGLRQGHDEPTQYHFIWLKYLPVTNSVQ